MSTKVKPPKTEEPSAFLSTSYNPFWSSSLFNEVYLRTEGGPEFALFQKEYEENIETFAKHYIDFAKHRNDLSKRKRSEADTIRDVIEPVLKMLGWYDKCNLHINEHPFVEEYSFTVSEDGKKKTYRSDLLLVDNPDHIQFFDTKLSNDNKIAAAQNKNRGAIMVVEAKKWDELDFSRHNNIRLDKKKKREDEVTGQSYEEQVLTYMKHLELEYGILTDGKVWKLFHIELSHGDFKKRSFDFNLGKLTASIRTANGSDTVERINKDNLRLFFSMFSKPSLFSRSKQKVPFVHRLLEYSKKYALDIESELKERFVSAMGIACNSFKKSIDESGEDLDLELLRNTAESHLFNILFVRSCESRRILPIHAPEYQKRSLAYVVGQMDEMEFDPKDLDLRDFPERYKDQFDTSTLDGTDLYDHLMNLYMTIHDGTRSKSFGFEIEGFRESVFSEREWKFARKYKMDNKAMLQILFHLNFTESSKKTKNPKKYQQIPYNFFIPRQLGSIYESFLEFRLEVAEHYLIFHKKQWRKAEPGSSQSIKLIEKGAPEAAKGSLFFTPDNKDRKVTGSYYTPDNIVRYILRNTVAEELRSKPSHEILNFSVCDPAMGSGHFLISALQYLTDLYRRRLSEENLCDLQESIEESARKILGRCIYGVDLNERAVKLAKMSLWLASAYSGKKLEHLKNQLVCGNSLIDNTDISKNAVLWRNKFPGIFKKGGFDAIIGNPPYVFTRGMHFSKEEKTYYSRFTTGTGKLNSFALFIEKALELIKQKGIIGFICPSNILRTTTYTPLRRLLIESKDVLKIALPRYKVFEGVTAETAIIFIKSRRDNEEIDVVDLETFGESNIRKINLFECRNNIECVVPTSLPSDIATRFAQMTHSSESVPLEELCDYIIEGIVTPKGKEKYISDHKKDSRYQKFLEGKDIGPYKVRPKKKYILYDRNILHRARPQEVHEACPKILIQRISGGFYPLKAAVDMGRHYTFASINNLILKEEYREWYYYLCGILNSSLMNAYYGGNFSNFSHLTVNIAGSFLEQLPIVLDKKRKLGLERIVQSISGKEDIDRKSNEISKIDSLVFEIYGVKGQMRRQILALLDNEEVDAPVIAA